MRNVYLSFLGTSKYISCNYISGHGEPVRNVRFVQEATVSWHCRQWSPGDRILIFTTEEAHEKNWLDNGQHDADNGGAAGYEGLKTRLLKMGLSAEITAIPIPSGKSEEEIWDIFSILIEALEDRDHLYLDITHALRSLPLLATVVVNYAKTVKNIQVKAIDYGAMEAIGPAWKVKEMDPEERNIPVFDLLSFDQLLDWSIAIDRFVSSGDAKGISALTTTKVVLRKKEVRGPDVEADGLQKMADALDRFSRTIATCRGKSISEHARRLQEAVFRVKNQQLIKPLNPLLEKLHHTISAFQDSEILDGIAASRWCFEHNLIQQSFTILQETMISYILSEATGEDTNNEEMRNLVGMGLTIERENLPYDEWKEEAKENTALIEQIRSWLGNNAEISECMVNLSQYRNDLNHAGMKANPMNASKFHEKLEEYIQLFEKIQAGSGQAPKQ